MDKVKCLVDNTEHESVYDLHYYLRKLKIKQKDYYEKYYQKRDLYTNEIIPFKDIDSYFKVSFLNKHNLECWADHNTQKAIVWAETYLKERKEEKKLVFAPHHVELKTLFCPTVRFLEQHGDYNGLCDTLGFKKSFDYKKKISIKKLPSDYIIIQDTREQTPLKFVQAKVDTLKYGDYTLCPKYNNGIYIERKSISDAVGTLGKDYERFYKEVERAKAGGHYLVVLVEEKYDVFKDFDQDYRMRYSKAKPAHIFRNIRNLLHEFPENLQFLFVDGRPKAADMVIKLLSLGGEVRTIDLQYALETKQI